MNINGELWPLKKNESIFYITLIRVKAQNTKHGIRNENMFSNCTVDKLSVAAHAVTLRYANKWTNGDMQRLFVFLKGIIYCLHWSYVSMSRVSFEKCLFFQFNCHDLSTKYLSFYAIFVTFGLLSINVYSVSVFSPH